MTHTTERDPAELLSKRTMIPISPRLLQEISDYRFERRIGSKSAAIRRLIAAGLQAERERAQT